MIKKLLIFWLLAPISSTLLACNPTETELIATEILDTFDDAGNTVEKYRNGIPLNEEEQNYFAKSFQAAIEKQLSTIDEKYKACNATGLCQARARVMQDLLEENRDIHEAILAQETYKFKGETIGRVKCEPAIFSTIEHYDVRFNDLPFGAKTKSTLTSSKTSLISSMLAGAERASFSCPFCGDRSGTCHENDTKRIRVAIYTGVKQ